MLEVKLLGQFEVQHDGRRLTIPTRNAQALFAYLLLNAGKAHRREKLAGLLWPDSSEENARSNLRHELWRLRKVIEIEGESYFLVDDLIIGFQPKNEYFLDTHELERTSLEKSTQDNLIKALSVYRGELLPGFYEEWVFVERNRFRALFEAKIARLLEILQAEGSWTEVLDWGMRWIAVEQWSEPANRAVISAYANRGDIAKAVVTYERFQQGIKKDLGIKPSEQSQALFKRLKAGWKMDGQKELSTRPTQTVRSPLGSTSAMFSLPKVRRTNLPRPMTSFVGREKEIQQVESVVARYRLVTITGAGGVGKTRLAIQAANAVKRLFQDGVWWVALASIFKTTTNHRKSSPEQASARQRTVHLPVARPAELEGAELVAQAIIKALRIPESPGLSPLEEVLEHLQDKELLLVLDNCEHLIEACAATTERILDGCPNVVIIATSRETLGIPGEVPYLLPSLSLPVPGRSSDLTAILQSEAVTLFIERAGDVLPDYRPVETDGPTIAQICLRLDGIPLAIELAAARMNLLSLQEIASRLDNRFSLLTGGHRTALPHHQTLQAAIEWSYDLLSQSEQVLFRRLSTFATRFTLEAAESICSGTEIQRDEVLTILGRLVDKSLLQVESSHPDIELPTYYHFLDTICSFAHLKLEEAEETCWLRDRHADYYACLAESAEPELLSQKVVHWHSRLLAENDNLRSVIEWSAECDQAENALRVVGALLWYWFRSGSNREGRDLALNALACPSAIQFRHARARALITAGFLLCLLGDTTAARQSLVEAVTILRTLDDETSLAWALQFLGLVFTYDRDYEAADAAFREGLAITQNLGNPHANSFLFFYGDVDLQRGETDRAQKRYEESADIFRATSNQSFLAYPLRRLGYLALAQNELSKAREYFIESLQLNHETSDIPGVTAGIASLAALSLRLDNPIIAARLFGWVESRLESLSINLLNLDQIELRKIQSQLLTRLEEETFTIAFTEGWKMSEVKAIALVRAIKGSEE